MTTTPTTTRKKTLEDKRKLTTAIADAVEHHLEKGRNVFLTGSQGTGKTTVTVEILQRVWAKGWRTSCTASTGIAVQNLTSFSDDAIRRSSFSTVHRAWSFGKDEVDRLDRDAATGDHDAFMREYKERWRECRAEFRLQLQRVTATGPGCFDDGPDELLAKIGLCKNRRPPTFLVSKMAVIDEASMLSAFFLRVLDKTARWWTGVEHAPFGGLRMLLVGDSQQLPPVTNDRDGNAEMALFFEADEWQRGEWVQRTVLLTENLRQSDDPAYADMLERMAHNALTPDDERAFQGAVLDDGYAAATNPAVLPGVLRVFNRLRECKAFSDAVLEEATRRGFPVLRLEPFTEWSVPKADAEAAYGHAAVNARVRALVDDAESKYCQEVFEGYPVFLRHNLDVSRGLANGARGRVVMLDEAGNPIVDFEGGVGEFVVERIARSTHVDDYDATQRAAIAEGRARPAPGRPVVKFVHYVHPLSPGCATTPWRVQGKTLDALVYDPAVGPQDHWVPRQAFYVVASRVTAFGKNEEKRGKLMVSSGTGQAAAASSSGGGGISSSSSSIDLPFSTKAWAAAAVERYGLALASATTDPSLLPDGLPTPHWWMSSSSSSSSSTAFGGSLPRGLFLTRFCPQKTYVEDRVRAYLDGLKRNHETRRANEKRKRPAQDGDDGNIDHDRDESAKGQDGRDDPTHATVPAASSRRSRGCKKPAATLAGCQ